MVSFQFERYKFKGRRLYCGQVITAHFYGYWCVMYGHKLWYGLKFHSFDLESYNFMSLIKNQ